MTWRSWMPTSSYMPIKRKMSITKPQKHSETVDSAVSFPSVSARKNPNPRKIR